MTQRGSYLNRKADHFVGSPLLFVLGHLQTTRAAPDTIRSVGVLTCSAIGDTVLTAAVACDMKRAFGARTIAFISPSSRGLKEVVEGFDEEVVVTISRPAAALRIIRQHPTDVLIDITPWPRLIALMAALSSARFCVGFRTPGQSRHFAYDAIVDHSAKRHELENYRALLKPLGVTGVALPRARADFQAGRRTGRNAPVIVFHPWPSGFRANMREWPQERWVELAKAVIAKGFHIALTGGSADLPRAECLAAMIGQAPFVRVLAGRSSLVDTAKELASSVAVVSVNTGLMHLAAALNCPMVALHGPTDPQRWGPLSKAAVVIGPGREQGGAYLNLGFEYPSHVQDCMRAISVKNVFACLQEIIGRSSSVEANCAWWGVREVESVLTAGFPRIATCEDG